MCGTRTIVGMLHRYPAGVAALRTTRKAMGLKACDLTCFPGCVDRPGINGCHSIIGNNTRMSRADKHETERVAAEKTQATLIEMSAGDAKLRKVLERVGLI